MKNDKKVFIFILVIIAIALFIWKGYPLIEQANKIEFRIKTNKVSVRVGVEVPIDYEINKEVNITWKSDNNNVVTINDGKIKGVGLGNTLIKGIVEYNGETITSSCYVSTFYGDLDVPLNDIVVPEGELFITKGDSYEIPLTYVPTNGYIDAIDFTSDNENIATFDGTVNAKSVGTTDVYIVINQNVSKAITVNVIEKTISPIFSKRIKSIDVDNSDVFLKVNESKDIEYTIEPKDAFVESVTWESSDPKVVTVNDGHITAISSGEATIKLVVNNEIVKEIKVTVSIPVTNLVLKSSSKINLKIGKTDNVVVEVSPSNATNKKVEYKSSNPSSATIDNNGLVTAISAGSGNITVKTEDGNHSVQVPFVVKPKTGTINGNGDVWGYTSSKDQTPVKSDESFFKSLVSKGKGTLSNGVYIYTDSKRTYKYTISSSTLNADNHNILMRLYYPTGVDLSTTNTFTFMGGSGERSFGGLLSALDKDRSQMKTSGIIALVSAKSSYGKEDALLTTDFIRSIFDQKSGVRNAVGGYSMSGDAAGDAAEQGIYDRLIIFDSYYSVSNKNSLKKKEVYIFSPDRDALSNQTASMLNKMKTANFNDVTLITNSSSFINNYSSYFLVINPGEPMGKGHGYVNIINAKIFSFAVS